MKKMLFKKILTVLDAIELQGIDLYHTPIRIYEELTNDYYGTKLPEIRRIVTFLHEKKALKETENGIDLNPAPTIYAKSNQNSGVEALSLFETFLHDQETVTFFKKMAKNNEWMDKTAIEEQLDKEIFQLLQQTILFETENEQYHFQPKLMKGIKDILKEYEDEQPPLISVALVALFTSNIVAHEDMRIDYKNTKANMIDYKFKETLLAIIPRRGIPHDRDETKALQAFYKDTLFHEFDHACPLCAINIPHMLIASHIKPFRDCAHIYEAIDHNNGLLLCRNHDYLFDQGYFTFDAHGYIVFSEEMLRRDHLEAYVLRKNYRLPTCFLTRERLQFLEYHRKNIFKDKEIFQ